MDEIINKCKILLEAYRLGKLGQTKMPEDSNPGFLKSEQGSQMAYFTLPMALNYQRDSYKLWESALKTYRDIETRIVFDLEKVSLMNPEELRNLLIKYKLALQPNKHVETWQRIAKSIVNNFGSFENMFEQADYNYLKLKQLIQVKYKKDFPYLSGPKIFNYWCFILGNYANISLKNREFIEIAPDTHITKCSVILGVINTQESETLSKEEISLKWRKVLKDSGINPIDLHPPLWFWSRNGFLFKLD